MKRWQESRTVEISVYGLTRGVGLTTHSYSIGCGSFEVIGLRLRLARGIR
jgi:hypothetical protein